MSRPDIQAQERYYDERWEGFSFANRLQLQRCVAILDGLRRTGIPRPRIVDLGCGPGWLTAVLGHFGPATGVDLSPQAVRDAALAYPHARFEHADVLHWKHPRGEFDVVVSQEVLEHVEDQPGYLRIAREMLREGGYLLLTTPNARTFDALPPEVRESWSTQPIESWRTAAELRRLLEEAGFRVLSLTTVCPGFGQRGIYRLLNSPRLDRLAARAGAGEALARLRLRLGLGLHLFAMARRR